MEIDDHDAGQVPIRYSLLLCLGLVILTAFLYLPYLGHTTLLHEEPRRALIARNMMDSGDYFVPVMHNRIYTAKPPLFNWLIIAASLPEGKITEFSARLPSVICLAMLAAVMVLGMRKFLDLSGLIFLGLSIVLSIEFMAKAHLAEIEMAFTLFVSLSLWSWFWLNKHERNDVCKWMLPLILVALGFLTKGPPAIVFFYLGTVPFLIIRKRWREIFSFGHLAGFFVMSLIIIGWIMMMINSAGMQALMDTVKREVIYRGISGPVGNYIQHMLFYPFELIAAILPFSLLLIPLCFRYVRKVLRSRYGDLYIFAVITVFANLPVYWLRADAAVRYFMPMFPSVLVLSALIFETYWSRSTAFEQRLLLALDHGVKAGSIVLVLLCLGLTASFLLPLWESAPLTIIPWHAVLVLGITSLIVSIYLYRFAGRNPGRALLPVLAGIMIVARLIYLCDLLPFKEEKLRSSRNVHALLEKVESITAGSAEPVMVIGAIPNDIWFYAKAGLLIQHEGPKVLNRGYFIGYEHEIKTLRAYRVLERIPYWHHDMLLGIFSKVAEKNNSFEDRL